MKRILLTTVLLGCLAFGAHAQWTSSGASIYNSNTGNVGIGTTTPASLLDVRYKDGSTHLYRATDSNNQFRWRISQSFHMFLSNSSGVDIAKIGQDFSYFNGGNVGIGTSNPQAKIEVFNSVLVGTSMGSNQLIARYGSNAGASNNVFDNKWIVRTAAGGNSWNTVKIHDGLSVDASYVTPGSDTRTWWERDPYNNIQSWGTAGSPYMTINAGNVGIGTVTPYGGKLQINAASDANNAVRLEVGAFSMGGAASFAIDAAGTSGGRFIVGSNGNVGIGTNAPDAKLAVNGNIHATEVRVSVNVPGPDYVFEKDYTLPSLESIKTYVDQNKHLPEVPSAKEMEANGINLSEMNMLLLKKIEELTLYVIDQRKEMDELKKGSVSPDTSGKKVEELILYMMELKDENKELKARIHKLESKHD
jgi:hypothetical protein